MPRPWEITPSEARVVGEKIRQRHEAANAEDTGLLPKPEKILSAKSESLIDQTGDMIKELIKNDLRAGKSRAEIIEGVTAEVDVLLNGV